MRKAEAEQQAAEARKRNAEDRQRAAEARRIAAEAAAAEKGRAAEAKRLAAEAAAETNRLADEEERRAAEAEQRAAEAVRRATEAERALRELEPSQHGEPLRVTTRSPAEHEERQQVTTRSSAEQTEQPARAESSDVPRERQIEVIANMLMHKLNCRLGQSSRVFNEVIKMASEIGDDKAIEAAQERVKAEIATVGRARWCQLMEPMVKQVEDLARQ